ncbi:MAG: SUMF1/EgtB/PvdO family nonheme iron enzyme [Anaerolineales bacterium]|nr:SUMF1/EgtB/PvdO family nonheme iron enzyme [Anaerolineales bacterium]
MTLAPAPESQPSGTGAELIGRDKIVVGDLTNTYAAIGAGASLIVHKARSRTGEIRREERLIEERLADALEVRLDRYRRAADAPPFGPTLNPYRALKSYEIEDASHFYGRATDIDHLWRHLNQPLTVLRAESGAGKSSLLKAGLAARLLAGGHLPIYLRPIDNYPTDELKAWFAPDFATQAGFERVRADSLTGFLERVTRLLGAGQAVVVLVDQFEEFFYYLPDGERRRFAAELADCVQRLRTAVRWVFAIRDEKYAGFGEFHPAINLSFRETYALRWTAEQGRETIVEPARLGALAYAPDLPDRIIRDLTADGRALSPLHLQLVCHTLFEAHVAGQPRDRCLIEAGRYEQAGGAGGILEHYLQDVLARTAGEADREAARFVLGELTTSGYRRTRRTAAALVAQWRIVAPDSPVTLAHVLNSLVANGLLVVRGVGEAADYELTHDFLARSIELDPHTRARKLAGELLAQDAQLWRAAGAAEEALIPRERLARIEPYIGALAPADDERELLRRSRDRVDEMERQEVARLERELAATRQSARLQRVLVVVFAAGTLGFLYVWLMPLVLRYRAAAVPLVPVPALGVAFEAYEVTNERYGWCVRAGRCNMPDGFRRVEAAWETESQQPVVGVDAADALDFCRWIGRTLPTADEWVAVAPPFEDWKEMGPDEALLCRLPGEACYDPNAPVGLTPVGAGRRSQYQTSDDRDGGIYDLVGSVMEWTRTQRVNRLGLVDVADLDDIPVESINIIALGDNFHMPAEEVGRFQLALEYNSTSDTRSELIGIRCVQ